jgi:hypothetical protein
MKGYCLGARINEAFSCLIVSPKFVALPIDIIGPNEAYNNLVK